MGGNSGSLDISHDDPCGSRILQISDCTVKMNPSISADSKKIQRPTTLPASLPPRQSFHGCFLKCGICRGVLGCALHYLSSTTSLMLSCSYRSSMQYIPEVLKYLKGSNESTSFFFRILLRVERRLDARSGDSHLCTNKQGDWQQKLACHFLFQHCADGCDDFLICSMNTF